MEISYVDKSKDSKQNGAVYYTLRTKGKKWDLRFLITKLHLLNEAKLRNQERRKRRKGNTKERESHQTKMGEGDTASFLNSKGISDYACKTIFKLWTVSFWLWSFQSATPGVLQALSKYWFIYYTLGGVRKTTFNYQSSNGLHVD